MKFINEPDKIAYIYAYVILIVLYIFQVTLYMKRNINTDPLTLGFVLVTTLIYPLVDSMLKNKKQEILRFILSIVLYTNIAYIMNYTMSDESIRSVKMIRKHSVIAVLLASVSVLFVSMNKFTINGYFIPSILLFTLLTGVLVRLTKEKLFDDFTPYLIMYMLLAYVMYDTKKCYSKRNLNVQECNNSTFLDLLYFISKNKVKA